jgi:Icc-related predicted phosphoesterase
MFVGTWTVAPDGTGTLNATKTGDSYVPLDDIGTVSIREVVEVGLPELEACGRVHENQ